MEDIQNRKKSRCQCCERDTHQRLCQEGAIGASGCIGGAAAIDTAGTIAGFPVTIGHCALGGVGGFIIATALGLFVRSVATGCMTKRKTKEKMPTEQVAAKETDPLLPPALAMKR